MARTDPEPTAAELAAAGWTACSCGNWHGHGLVCPDGGVAVQ